MRTNLTNLAHLIASDSEIEAFIQEAAQAGDAPAIKRARQALRGNKAARNDVAVMIAEAAVAEADAAWIV